MKTTQHFTLNTLTLAIIAGTLSTSFVAQADDKIDDVITVTASRTPMPLDSVLADQVVITRADIDLQQPSNITDLLENVPGIDIVANGGKGQATSVLLRGTESDQTLVLVDGIRVSSATSGGASWQTIAPQMIERIEIVKGPRAALWGSDAIGGVIQIFTRKDSGNNLQLGASYGSFNTRRATAAASVQHGEGSTTIGVMRELSDGFDVLEAAEEDDDGYAYTSVAINGQQNINKQLSLNWLAQLDEGNSEYDTKYSTGTNLSSHKNHVWALKATYETEIAGSNNQTYLTIGQNRNSSRDYRLGNDEKSGSLFETRRDQFSVLNSTQLTTDWQVNLGADLYNESVNSTSDFSEDERDIQAIFAHTLYQQDGFTADLAVRYDDVENIDSETTYNTGLGYQLGQHQFIINWGTGFNAPTFNDLYYPAGTYSAGNPDLLSERSNTLEISYKTQIQQLDVDLSWYRSNVKNLIEWAADENYFYQPQNVSKAEIQGVELGLTLASDNFGQHQLNLSYLDAADASTDYQLARRAKQQLDYSYQQDFGALTTRAEVQYRGKVNDSSHTVVMGGYTLVNLALSYEVSDQWQVKFKVNNLTDKNYQTANGYNTADRNAMLSVNYSLN